MGYGSPRNARVQAGPAIPTHIAGATSSRQDSTSDGVTSGLLDAWEPFNQRNVTADDNDKRFAVPTGEEWHIQDVLVKFVSDATVGNRQIVIERLDAADNVLSRVEVGATQAASLTRYYQLGPSLADLTSFRDTDYLMTPIPPTWGLRQGWQIRVYDRSVVSGTDDMEVELQYWRRLV